MARKKRNLFRELAAGIRAMRDHADGKIELRTTFVSVSRTVLENAASERTASRRQKSRRGVADVGAGVFHGRRMLLQRRTMG